MRLAKRMKRVRRPNRIPRRAATLAVALLALTTLSARAQVGAKQGELGFDLGGTNLDDGRGGETRGSFSIRGGYHFSDLFQLEGQVREVELDDGQGPGHVELSTFFVNAVFNFHPTENIVPYVLVGLGEAETEVYGYHHHDHHHDHELTVIDSAEAGQVALGSRFFVGKGRRLALRVEAAMMFEEGFDNNNEHFSFAGGLTWRLGRGRDAAGNGTTADTVPSAPATGRTP